MLLNWREEREPAKQSGGTVAVYLRARFSHVVCVGVDEIWLYLQQLYDLHVEKTAKMVKEQFREADVAKKMQV